MNVNYDTLDAMANILDYRYIIVEKDSVYYPGPNFKSAVTSTPPIEEGLNKIGKGLKVRPEELSLAEFLVLFKEINQQ